MGVCVHQPRQDGDLAKIDFICRGEVAWTRVAERHDASVIGPQPCVADRRLRNRQQPGTR